MGAVGTLRSVNVGLPKDVTWRGRTVFTDDPDQAQRVANHLDTGMVFINGVLADGAELPFGGVKRSGFGRELGPYGMDEFVNKKLIRVIK